MAKYLVIVESPAKVKTIKKFLGANYDVEASNGHVRDFPKSQFGIDVEHDFEPKYITIRGKGELLAKLRKAAKKADKIYLATDPDREGEAISWHLMQALKEDPKKMHRITFNEITKTAVKSSIKQARDLDMDDAESLLRYFGYERSNKGRTSGSRIVFVSEQYPPILMHKPHPRKELLEYHATRRGWTIYALPAFRMRIKSIWMPCAVPWKPNSSIKAPLVPDPSSLDIGLISPEKSPPLLSSAAGVSVAAVSVFSDSCVVSVPVVVLLLPHPVKIIADTATAVPITAHVFFIIKFPPSHNHSFSLFI